MSLGEVITFGEWWICTRYLTWDLSFSDASSYDNRDTNGCYRCPREKVQTNGLKMNWWKVIYVANNVAY